MVTVKLIVDQLKIGLLAALNVRLIGSVVPANSELTSVVVINTCDAAALIVSSSPRSPYALMLIVGAR